MLAEIFTPTVAIVGKTWGLHLSKVIRVSRDENLRMIDESVRFLAAQGKRVVYDAEHFFDAWRDDREYALRCVTAAAEAGAAVVCLCDTNGASLPPFVADVVREVTAALPAPSSASTRTTTATAPSPAASWPSTAGARQVQGTINGYGERCGNANLVSIIPALKLKMGLPVVERRAARAAHRDVALRRRRRQRGHLGARALRGPLRLRPQGRPARRRRREGARRRSSTSTPRRWATSSASSSRELSGKGAVRAQGAGARPPARGRRRARRPPCSSGSRTREHEGYHYEAADASFDLLLREELAPHEPLFRLESFRVIVEKREDGKAVVEATIKVHVGGERIISTAEGNGPVNALDSALRQAIVSKYPHLADIELVNYKVRILDETKGTGAVTRVLLDASDGEESWGSIGVSENVVEASWEALVDSIEFGMLRGRG